MYRLAATKEASSVADVYKRQAPAAVEPSRQPESATEPKPESKDPQEPKQKGGAQYRRALTLAWDGPEEKSKAQTIAQSVAQLSGIAAIAAEFLQELQQFRESLEAQGREFSEDELKEMCIRDSR